MARVKVGLLGGSFNPAHAGHRYISLLALKQLQLDQVWWLVSPQNPLKTSSSMLPFKEREASAQMIARHPRIRVSDIENQLGTSYTIDTLALLHRRWPDYRFVWLMGADNLKQLPRWRRWREIARTIPIAVFNRDGEGHRALAGAAATAFANSRKQRSVHLPLTKAPAWCFLFSRQHGASSTSIRASRQASRK